MMSTSSPRGALCAASFSRISKSFSAEAARVFNGPRRDRVHADALRAEFIGQIAARGLQRRLDRAHDIVVRNQPVCAGSRSRRSFRLRSSAAPRASPYGRRSGMKHPSALQILRRNSSEVRLADRPWARRPSSGRESPADPTLCGSDRIWLPILRERKRPPRR
jgi:hypothetical protein